MDATWDDSIDRFWADFDHDRPEDMRDAMRALAAQRPAGDAAALFEMASAYDSTGQTFEAIELYRTALDAGLDPLRAPQAMLQLASSLRAEGRYVECLDVLDSADSLDSAEVIGDADAVVRALALHSLGRHDEALSVALIALARTLPRYNRSMTAYAEALTEA